jgi:hypothetical protein
VTGVTDQDTTGGDPPVVTSFAYSGAAWHYDDDTVIRSATQTWDQWRGFHSVTTKTGTSPDPVTQTTDTYFQGISDDYRDLGTMPVNIQAEMILWSENAELIIVATSVEIDGKSVTSPY